MKFIGIGITTTPNRNFDLSKWEKYLPKDSKIIVNNDENYDGVAISKNKLLAQLDDYEHIFLVDDDVEPLHKDWWKPYVESKEPHLQYQFKSAPSHWNIDIVKKDEHVVAYDKSRGCVLYIESRILPIVGGMSYAFGKHGREHENWSLRIHQAGLTSYPFQDVNTKNFYCKDEDNKAISSVPSEQKQAWKFVDEKRIPLYQDYKNLDVPVLVARRQDFGRRDYIWRTLKNTYWTDYIVYEGHHVEHKFNRSLGMNLASELAGNWDIAVLIDSDVFIEPEKIKEAIKVARESQALVSPFTQVVELNKTTSDDLLVNGLSYDFEPENIEVIRTKYTQIQSLILIVPRNLWEQVQGFDERFKGWGGEDNAFWHCCKVIAGEPYRLEGNVYHLWHEKASRQSFQTNNRRWHRYKVATTREQIKRVRNSL